MTELEILEYTYLSGGFTTRSNFARDHTEVIAKLACLGFLTTATPRDGFGSVWRLTVYGLTTLAQETLSYSQYHVEQEQNLTDAEAFDRGFYTWLSSELSKVEDLTYDPLGYKEDVCGC